MVLVRATALQKQRIPRQSYATRAETRSGGAYRGSGSESIIGLFPASVRTRRPPIVYCHGGGGGHADIMNDPLQRIAQGFLQQGFPILSADLGIPFSWGNDDSLDAIGDAIAYGAATWGTRTDQVALWGDSHGAVMALITAARNPSRTPFVYGQVPVVGLASLRANPAAEAPFGAGIDAAYGGNPGYLAALPTHDPSAVGQTVALRGYGDRLRIDADISDIYNLHAMYDTFMTEVPQADFRWFPGIHFHARYHDRNELGRWAASMADAYA